MLTRTKWFPGVKAISGRVISRFSWDSKEVSVFDITITPTAKQDFLIPFGISEERATETVTNHDQVAEIREPSGQLIISIYMKRFNFPKPQHYILAIVIHLKGDKMIQGAVKVFDSLDADLEAMSPLNMLRALTESFGLTLTIGEESSKFFYDTSIPVKSREPSEFLKIPLYKGIQASCFFSFCLSIEDPPVLDIRAVFAIDRRRMVEWIQQSEKEK